MQMFQKARCRPAVLCHFLVLLAFVFSGKPANAQDQAALAGAVAASPEDAPMAKSGPGQSDQSLSEADAGKLSNPAAAELRVASLTGNEVSVPATSGSAAVQTPASSQRTRAQGDIERAVRRFQIGVRGGVALDPELILFGVQAQVGPFFRSNVFFRPSVEFGLGEVTAMFAFSPEIIYRLPVSSAQDRWSTYFGAGLGINLLHQNFERDTGGSRIDFGDFHSDTALNILGGVRHRTGTFLELRTSVYSDPSPTLRLVVGYNF